MTDITAEIRRGLDAARAKWGETFDFKMLELSWGDTLTDAEMLTAVHRFLVTGKYLDCFLGFLEPQAVEATDAGEAGELDSAQ